MNFTDFDKYTKPLAFFSIISYVTGFLIWTFFLYGFGFNEIEVLQTRFILTGASFLLFVFIFFLLIRLPYRFISWITLSLRTKSEKKVVGSSKFLLTNLGSTAILILTLIAIILIFFYSVLIFPHIPRIFGGGRPKFQSLILQKDGNNLSLEFLKKFGVYSKPEWGETQSLCVVYENSDSILFPLTDRFIRLERSNILGTKFLPSDETLKFEKECVWITSSVLLNGLGFENNKIWRWLFKISYSNEPQRLNRIIKVMKDNSSYSIQGIVQKTGFSEAITQPYLNSLIDRHIIQKVFSASSEDQTLYVYIGSKDFKFKE